MGRATFEGVGCWVLESPLGGSLDGEIFEHVWPSLNRMNAKVFLLIANPRERAHLSHFDS